MEATFHVENCAGKQQDTVMEAVQIQEEGIS